uniref:Uncharacterized protein n=1 Tax=Zonotrichia albicollis TaxID=44394 RepID=A0A8D2MWM2_ZONAL
MPCTTGRATEGVVAKTHVQSSLGNLLPSPSCGTNKQIQIPVLFPFPPGNKSDLSDLREVQLEEAQSLAERYDNIICAIETSAKDSSNVEEAFVKMATELMMRHGGPMFSEKNTDSIKLDSKDVVEGWGCGC